MRRITGEELRQEGFKHHLLKEHKIKTVVKAPKLLPGGLTAEGWGSKSQHVLDHSIVRTKCLIQRFHGQGGACTQRAV